MLIPGNVHLYNSTGVSHYIVRLANGVSYVPTILCLEKRCDKLGFSFIGIGYVLMNVAYLRIYI